MISGVLEMMMLFCNAEHWSFKAGNLAIFKTEDFWMRRELQRISELPKYFNL